MLSQPAQAKGAAAPSAHPGPGQSGSTGSGNALPKNGSALVPREPTASQILHVSWDFGSAPRSTWAEQPLPASEALAALAGDDPRPLLVLRECENCAGTDDAFLERELDNERTILLGRWFHAVKLGADVLDEKHPFHALFAGGQPAHLFVATRDGRTRRDMDGAQSQARLWSAMLDVLRKSYCKDPQAGVTAMLRLLDRLDESDRRLAGLDERLQQARAAGGAASPGLRSVQAAIDTANAERERLVEQGRTIDDLQLRPAPDAPTSAGSPSGSPGSSSG